jgi:hypothetical protein
MEHLLPNTSSKMHSKASYCLLSPSLRDLQDRAEADWLP